MRCRTCLNEKDASAFYATNKSRCKECVRGSVNAYRQANLEAVRAYDRMRGSMPHRVAARREYQDTPEGRAAHKRALKASINRYPERRIARDALGKAVRAGRILPWPVCAVPHCCAEPEGHHPDYSRPLSVVWLCTEHHRAAHVASAEMEIV